MREKVLSIAIPGALLAVISLLALVPNEQMATLAEEGEVVIPDSGAHGALRHPDAATLELWSEAAGVPPAFTFAIAWQETRNNASPAVRGRHGEYGRFQILLSTARTRCPGLNVVEYEDNLACFLRMARQDWLRCGSWRCAARTHNGSGLMAERYADSVMQTVREIVNAKVGA